MQFKQKQTPSFKTITIIKRCHTAPLVKISSTGQVSTTLWAGISIKIVKLLYNKCFNKKV